MPFDRQTREDIAKVLESHLGSEHIGQIEEIGESIRIQIAQLGKYSGIKNIPLNQAGVHHRNLANAYSVLEVFCKDRKLDALYNFEENIITISKK